MTDITSGLSQILDIIISGLTFCFNTLDSIGFMGISLLDYIIWLFVLGIILPIIVTLLNSSRSEARSEYRSEARRQRHAAEAQARRESNHW